MQWAQDSAEKQAGHFFDSRVEQIDRVSSFTTNPPLIVCPYDAELYGHWWYEGPNWLYLLFKKVYYDKCNFKLITPSEYIDKYPLMQISTPCRSSWGANGYSEVWLNPSNDYAHNHLLEAGDRMVELARKFENLDKYMISKNISSSNINSSKNDKEQQPNLNNMKMKSSAINAKIEKEIDLYRRALNQCARELLLAQSSDWLFIITNGTMVDYAKKRIKDHIGRFTKLYEQIKADKIDEEFLKSIMKLDKIFPDIDYMIYY